MWGTTRDCEERPEAESLERRLLRQEPERFTECVLPYLDAAHILARRPATPTARRAS